MKARDFEQIEAIGYALSYLDGKPPNLRAIIKVIKQLDFVQVIESDLPPVYKQALRDFQKRLEDIESIALYRKHIRCTDTTTNDELST